MKTPIQCVLFVSLALLMQSCSRDCRDDCPPRTVTNYLRAEDLAKIPYTGFEAITLVNTTTTDTIVFLAEGWRAYWWKDIIPAGENNTVVNQEAKDLAFSSPNYPHKLEFTVYCNAEGGGGVILITFKGTEVTESCVTIRKPYTYDSITLADRMYYKVEKITDRDLLTQLDYYCLYNVEYGILKLRLKNGEEWLRIPN